MLHEFLLIECVVMTWQSFRDYGFYLLSLHLWSAYELEAFIILLIGSLTFENKRFVSLQGDNVGTAPALFLSYLSQHLIVFSKLPLLLFIVVHSVTRITFEWKRIEWVLRMLLMENITLTVFPIWIVLHIG